MMSKTVKEVFKDEALKPAVSLSQSSWSNVDYSFFCSELAAGLRSVSKLFTHTFQVQKTCSDFILLWTVTRIRLVVSFFISNTAYTNALKESKILSFDVILNFNN